MCVCVCRGVLVCAGVILYFLYYYNFYDNFRVIIRITLLLWRYYRSLKSVVRAERDFGRLC